MSNASLHPELPAMLSRVVDGTIAPEEFARLERLLLDDPSARAAYHEHLRVHALLYWRWNRALAEPAIFDDAELFAADAKLGVAPPAALHPFLSTLHSPLSPPFVGGPVFSYIAATLILGVMLLGAWAYKISHDYGTSLAANSRGSTTPGLSTPQRPELVFVARVTGLVDCRWADPQTETYAGAFVPLGRKYALSSGLMEITYRSGAKVILEGPCRYEVESPAGGFLALGKLTAKVESEKQRPKAQAPRPKTEISKSPNLQISIFAVRTPTAIVTDLGTEFGVEVAENGDTTSHVFQGSIQVRVAGGPAAALPGGPAASAAGNAAQITLAAGESAQVEKGSNGRKMVISRGRADAAAFVRPGRLEELARETRLKPFRRWQAHCDRLLRDESLVAYYDFQQEAGSPAVLRNRAGGDRKLDGEIHDATWTDGRMHGKQALLFRGESDYVQINIPREMDNVTVAARVTIDRFDKDAQGLLMSDGCSELGRFNWHIFADRKIALVVLAPGSKDGGDNRWIHYDTRPLPEETLPEGKLSHLAVVYDGGSRRVTLYVNGEAVGERTVEQHVPLTIGAARIANWDPGDFPYHKMRDRSLCGRMEEMAVFARALTGQEIQQLYEAGAYEKEDKSMKQ